MKTLLLGAATMAATLALPAVSLASTFAYVNTNGEVQTMDAPTAIQALNTAPNIALHSGVMLIQSLTDTVVGTHVSGA